MDVSATEAGRRFSEILDAVEHRGESFTIVRRGRRVARIGPAVSASGREVKRLLGTYRDAEWEGELRDLRAALVVEERPWNA